MTTLKELRDIRLEVLDMKFDYKNTHRIQHLIYETRELLEQSFPIPNKDIALHQTNKVIDDELMKLIRSKSDEKIENNFKNLTESFKLVLAYIA